eukprot:TRINITY_DN20287_c0_g1_i1.p1 TRINITY_DN20287_c0_g1~~TRINITY_DN20287_c0_g1_i1.p1  ORF type:complete len:362 (-),score=65.58 TRINITY_DN20287_c0_g1_i1:48-1133(-)
MRGRPAKRRITIAGVRAFFITAGAILLIAWHFFGHRPLQAKIVKEVEDGNGELSNGAVLGKAEGLERKMQEVGTGKKLANGAMIPSIGFGTAGLGDDTKQAVTWALKAGYRLLDSAQAREWYQENEVGIAIQESGIPRSELFLVSKLHPRHIGYAITRDRFEDSLRDLGTSYLDLFLLHYPWCFSGICGEFQPVGTWHESWRALEDLHAAGKARAIGVSNFDVDELRELLRIAKVRPMVVQARSDPFEPNRALQELCKKENLQFMGYSTLGNQWRFQGYQDNPVLTNPTVKSVAEEHGCSPAQVALKWALENGQVVIPRSSDPGRIRENLETPRCKLTQRNVEAIDRLEGKIPDHVSQTVS